MISEGRLYGRRFPAGKNQEMPVYLPDDRTNRNNGDKNEHAYINVITALSVPGKTVSDDFMLLFSVTAPQESYFLHRRNSV